MYNQFQTTIPKNAHNTALLNAVRQAAKPYIGAPIPALPYSKFRLFFETGSRVEYEAAYIEHRKRMNFFTALSLGDPDPKWILELCDTLFAVCDEFTWSFPAHLKHPDDAAACVTQVDLFSAETGFALCEILYLLKDRLPKLICDRIRYEVNRRILTPYLLGQAEFLQTNNWAAVCAGSVGCMLIYLSMDKEFALAKSRLLASMQSFIGGYQPDGCCLEGALYWSYGFGYFCFFAALLRDYTKGEVNLFADKKVARMAAFGQNAFLRGNIVLPFSDAPHNLTLHVGLSHFLAREYPHISVPAPCCESALGDDTRYRFADFIRDFFWYDESLAKAPKQLDKMCCYPDSQWFIRRFSDGAFAAKGGHNNEPHNHNDVGGFVLLSGDDLIVDDLGWPEYYAGYFGPNRYDDICASAHGHSVPVLNGQVQTAGADRYAALLCAEPGQFSLDLTHAYPEVPLDQFTRTFFLSETAIRLTDRFLGALHSVSERFVTRIPPQIEKNSVHIGNWRLRCEQSAKITVSKRDFSPRLSICKMDMKPVETAYFIDFSFLPSDTSFALQFLFEKC